MPSWWDHYQWSVFINNQSGYIRNNCLGKIKRNIFLCKTRTRSGWINVTGTQWCVLMMTFRGTSVTNLLIFSCKATLLKDIISDWDQLLVMDGKGHECSAGKMEISLSEKEISCFCFNFNFIYLAQLVCSRGRQGRSAQCCLILCNTLTAFKVANFVWSSIDFVKTPR